MKICDYWLAVFEDEEKEKSISLGFLENVCCSFGVKFQREGCRDKPPEMTGGNRKVDLEKLDAFAFGCAMFEFKTDLNPFRSGQFQGICKIRSVPEVCDS